MSQEAIDETLDITDDIAEDNDEVVFDYDPQDAERSGLDRLIPTNVLPHPKRDEAIDLIQRYRDGDKKAGDEMITRNLRLVMNILVRYARQKGVLRDTHKCQDLFQEGVFGLQKALDNFDLERGFAFSTYATWWVRQTIDRAYRNDNKDIVRIPIHYQAAVDRLNWCLARFFRANGRSVNIDFDVLSEYYYERWGANMKYGSLVAQKTPKATKRKISSYLEELYHGGFTDPMREFSSDTPMFDDGEISFGDTLPSDTDVEKLAELDSETMKLCQLVSMILDDRSRQILRMRFIMDKTLEECGEIFKITRERVRQIEAKAIKIVKAKNANYDAHIRNMDKMMSPELFFDVKETDNVKACELKAVDLPFKKVGDAPKVVAFEPRIKITNDAPAGLRKGSIPELTPTASASQSERQNFLQYLSSKHDMAVEFDVLEREIYDVVMFNRTKHSRDVTPEDVINLLKVFLIEMKTQKQVCELTGLSQAVVSRWIKRWRLYKGREHFYQGGRPSPFSPPPGYPNLVVQFDKKPAKQYADAPEKDVEEAEDYASKNQELIHNFENLSRLKGDNLFSPHQEAILTLMKEGVSALKVSMVAKVNRSYIYQIRWKYNKYVKDGLIKGELFQ